MICSVPILCYIYYIYFLTPHLAGYVSVGLQSHPTVYIYISTINPTYIHHKPAISPCSGSQEPWGYFADFAPQFRAQIQTLRWDREDPVDLYGSHKIG